MVTKIINLLRFNDYGGAAWKDTLGGQRNGWVKQLKSRYVAVSTMIGLRVAHLSSRYQALPPPPLTTKENIMLNTKSLESCECDSEYYRGVFCHYKDGCKYEKDCKWIEENFENVIDSIPCNDAVETGSRYICDPPVMDTDEDWILDCSGEGQMKKAERALKSYGFFVKAMADDNYDDISENFTSYNLGHINFILCNNRPFFQKFVLATELAKDLNLVKKDDRIKLFQGVLYGKVYGEEYL